MKPCFQFARFILTECNDSKDGVKCSEICGYCLNKTNCHLINGSCLEGCDPSFQGDKCLGGTFFIVIKRVMNITWSYFVMRVERIDDKKTKVLNICVHFNMSVSLKKKCALKIIDKSLVSHIRMPRYKKLKEDGIEANDINVCRSCIVLSRCACRVPHSHKSFSWTKVHVNISSRFLSFCWCRCFLALLPAQYLS